jgi:hypothetical protein
MPSESPAGAAVDALQRLARRLPRKAGQSLRYNLSILVGEFARAQREHGELCDRYAAVCQELGEMVRRRVATRKLLRHGVHGNG